jgi:hypothetical protein
MLLQYTVGMVRSGRKRWILKWAGLLSSFLILSTWAWSYWDTNIHDLGSFPLGEPDPHYDDGVELALRVVQLGEGEVHFIYSFKCPRSMTLLAGLIDWSWLKVDADGIDLNLQLWILFMIAVIPTGVLWYVDRRRIPPGHCRKCGYNLTGNVSGVCPECGGKVGG